MTGLNKICSIACILFLLPLLHINVKQYHDWGDDYAQYLFQARNIVEHKPQTENGLVFDKVDGDFALHAYPAGFPLIISPVYYFFQLSVKPYLVLISLFMIGLGWLMYNYFKKYFSPLLSLLVVLFILYNRYPLWLKDSILSDIPFVFFLFLLIFIIDRKKSSALFYIGCGILASWLTSIRFVGIASIAALVATIFFHEPTEENKLNFSLFDRKRIFPALIFLVSATSFFILFNILTFHVAFNDFLGFYSNSFNKETSGLLVNAKYYYEVFGTVFLFPGSKSALSSWWIYFALAGWLWNLRKTAGFTEWFFLFYILIILLFNRNTGGFRFIFPIFPLLIKYTIDIIILLSYSTGKIFRESIIAIMILFFMVGYEEPIRYILQEQNIAHDGPYLRTSSEMLDVVKNKIPQNEVIGFAKALAISMYTNHPATYLMTGQSPDQVEAMFGRLHVNYLIVTKIQSYDTDIYDPRINAYLEQFRKLYQIYWENGDYIILKRFITN